MPKAEIRFSNTPGRIPTIEELEGFKFGWNIYDAILYGVEEIAGVKTVVPIGGGGGGGSDHPRAHQIDSVLDHPPVPEGKRGKIVATDLTTGEIELIDKSQIALDVYSEDDGFYPVETIYKKFPESNAERITTIQKPQGLMYGGHVSWLDGMLFAVSGAIYFIRGELYKADDLRITLQASNPDNPRIDVIVATEDNEFSVIAGTPAANALKPYINPITQVEIAEILIPAGATGFGGSIFRNVIYNENTEWTGTGVGVVVYFDSTTDPYFGLKCADVGNIQTADYVKFESSGNVSIVDYDLLHLALKFKFNVTKLSALLVEFYLDGVLVSSPRNVPFLSGPDKWQHISIEMSSISFSDAFYNEIRFVWFYPVLGGVTYQPGFYLDYIRLEKGISPPPTPTTIYLAGDVSGSGSVGHAIRTTLRTVNSDVGTFGSTTKIPKVTVNKKGLVTAVEEVDAEGNIALPPGGITDQALVKKTDDDYDVEWKTVDGGSATFLALIDTPSTYAGQAGKVPQVNSGETGLEWGSGGDGLWKRTANKIEPSTLDDILEVATTNLTSITGKAASGVGIYGYSVDGYAGDFRSINNIAINCSSTANVAGYFKSTNNVGVRGISTNDNGGYFTSSYAAAINASCTNYPGGIFTSGSSNGLRATSTSAEALQLNSTSSYAFVSTINPSSTNNIAYSFRVIRTTSGTAGDGIGTGTIFILESSSGSANEQAATQVMLTNATFASETSAFAWLLRNAGAALAEVMRLTGAGVLNIKTGFSVDGTPPVADGTYTVGIGSTQNGTITTKGGIITAIQEAI